MAKPPAPRKRRERRYVVDVPTFKAARDARGLSQRELAVLVGVHSSLIAQFETGRCLLSDRVLERVADELGVTWVFTPAEEAS